MKIIWNLWYQGWEECPEVSRICNESWKQFNPDYTVINLDRHTLPHYLDTSLLKNLQDKTGMSDIIRILLLNQHGGVWVDSTVLCTKPLNDWLPEGMFAFHRPSAQHRVASWFLSAPTNDYIIDTWCQYTINYWRSRSKKDNYFWFHRLFNKCYSEDKKFKNIWDQQIKITCNYEDKVKKGPHIFVPYDNKPISKYQKNRFENKMDPCYKLTWKKPIIKGSAVDYILKDFKNKYMK